MLLALRKWLGKVGLQGLQGELEIDLVAQRFTQPLGILVRERESR